MILIGLGANLVSPAGPPAATLRAALARLGDSGVVVLRVSPFYASTAWPDPAEPDFVNAAASIATELHPLGLLAALHQTEAAFGRVRGAPNASRTLDLDVLDFHGAVQDGPLVLPHPRLHERAFVLRPLADLAPRWVHPRLGVTVEALLDACPPSGLRLLAEAP